MGGVAPHTPKRRLVRRLLVHGICPFEDETRAATAARKASVEARRLVPSDCAVWVRSRHTKDGGIMSEMSLSMRAPSVVPRYAVAVGSLKVCRGGTAIGKTPEERGNFN